ncbi:MAG: hypothetical protein ACPGEG_02690 [Salibacteraceae bacterium]
MNKYWISHKIEFSILIVLGIVAGLIVVYKAATLSFTHDESGTYLYLNQLSIWQVFTHEDAWKSANNHILNTILYKFSIHLFGHSDFTMRLPNVLAYLGSLLAALWVINNKLSKSSSRFVLFTILFFNPYILDFYSLSRGYGLSMFFHFSFLVCIWHFKEKQNFKSLYLAYAMLSLASLSLLTNLVLFPIYTLVLWITFKANSGNFRKKLILIPLVFGISTLAVVVRPLLYLIGKDELKFGVASIWDSLKSLIIRTFHYIPEQEFMWIHDILTVILLIGISWVLYFSLIKKMNNYFALSFLILVITLHILYFGFDIRFPNERKTTIYVPILALLFSTYIEESNFIKLRHRFYNIAIIFASLIPIFSNQLDRSIEWAYDRKTKDYMRKIQEAASNQRIVVLTEWWFTPTAEYYLKTLELKNIHILPYNKNFNLSSQNDMVISHKSLVSDGEYVLVDSDEELGLFSKK